MPSVHREYPTYYQRDTWRRHRGPLEVQRRRGSYSRGERLKQMAHHEQLLRHPRFFYLSLQCSHFSQQAAYRRCQLAFNLVVLGLSMRAAGEKLSQKVRVTASRNQPPQCSSIGDVFLIHQICKFHTPCNLPKLGDSAQYIQIVWMDVMSLRSPTRLRAHWPLVPAINSHNFVLYLAVKYMSNKIVVIHEYLATIGRKGGHARAAKYGKSTLKKWARLGGRPPKEGTSK